MPAILHVIDTCGPGGAETVFVELATSGNADAAPSLAVITGPGWVADTLRERGVEPTFIPMGRRMDIGFVLRLCRLVRRHRIELIHAHLFSTGVYAALAALLTRRRLIVTIHGHTEIEQGARLSRLRFGLLRWASDYVVTVSDSLGKLLRNGRTFRPEQVRTIHNGVDVGRFRAARTDTLREQLAVPEHALLVGAVGNFRESKDYTNLIRAIAHARQDGAPIVCAIVGQFDRRYYPEALALQRELGLEHAIHFLGFSKDIPGFLAGVDAYALSSSAEGFSIVVVEAMVAGLPVVATRSGGPEEIVSDGVDGLLVPPRDPAALGDALATLARDEALRERLAGAATDSAARRFTRQAMLDAYHALYRKAR